MVPPARRAGRPGGVAAALAGFQGSLTLALKRFARLVEQGRLPGPGFAPGRRLPAGNRTGGRGAGDDRALRTSRPMAASWNATRSGL
jgi:hypothetical protein